MDFIQAPQSADTFKIPPTCPPPLSGRGARSAARRAADIDFLTATLPSPFNYHVKQYAAKYHEQDRV